MLGKILQHSVVLGTVVMLAFAAENSLSSLATFGDRQVSSFTVQAQGKWATHPGASDFEVRIVPIVDGRSLTSDSVERSGNWQPGLRPMLYRATKDNFEHGLLRFQGKELVLVLDARSGLGLVHFTRDNGELRSVNFSTSEGDQRPIALESPSVSSSLPVFVGALVIFAGCAWWFGPIHSGRSSIVWLIFFLSIFHLLFWASQFIGTTNDSPSYLNAFSEVMLGRPSYFPPGYPVFLGLVQAISSANLGRSVTLIQHGMAVAGAVWIYLLLQRIVAEEVALLGGILAGGLAPVLTMSQSVLSETPTLFAMVGAVYLAVRSAETGRIWVAILAGLLAGWAGTLRIVPLVGLLPSMCVAQLLAPRKYRFHLVGATVIVTAVIMILPVVWFGYKSGEPKLAKSIGFHLFNRVVNEQKQLDEDGPATKVLLSLLEGKDPRGVDVWWIHEHLKRRGLTFGQMESLFRQVSLEGIRKDPWAFLLFTPRLAWKILSDDSPRNWLAGWWGTDTIHPQLENPPPLRVTASGLMWRLTLEVTSHRVWSMVCWAALAGIVLGGFLLQQRLLILALAWVPAGYLLSTAAVEFVNPRYNVPVIPFLVALSMVPIGLVVNRFSRAQPNHPHINIKN